MNEMEDKLNAVLGNPEMMAQIMAMAQQLGGGAQPPPPKSEPEAPQMPDGLDMGMLMKIAGMANSANIDTNQRTLLHALQPYLVCDRITRLEKAMRAAKLAGIATQLLGSSLLSQRGR